MYTEKKHYQHAHCKKLSLTLIARGSNRNVKFVFNHLKMKKIKLLLALFLFSTHLIFAQHSKKGFEYSGIKNRVTLIGKSKMFSEGVKSVNFTIYWNKKKNTIQVNAGEKDTWYTILLSKVYTIQGVETHIGYLEGTTPITDALSPDKNRFEVKFQMDRISIKKGEALIEEFLVDGATIWNDQTISIK